MNFGRLAPLFLFASIVTIAIDFFLPSTLDGSGLLGGIVAWGLLALSLFLLLLFVAFRRRSF